MAADGSCLGQGQVALRPSADLREQNHQQVLTMPRKTVPPPANIHRLPYAQVQGVDPGGSDTDGKGDDRKEEIPVRVHHLRPTTQDQVDAFMRQIKEGKDRAVPYPQYDELDLRNDPRGWRFGLHVREPEDFE